MRTEDGEVLTDGGCVRLHVDVHRDADSGVILAVDVVRIIEVRTGREIPTFREFVAGLQVRSSEQSSERGKRFQTREKVLRCWW